jgi:hypothetical protein
MRAHCAPLCIVRKQRGKARRLGGVIAFLL